MNLILDRDLEYSLIIVKPDGYRRGLTGEILARIERKGYRLVALEVTNATEQTLAAHYQEHANKHFFAELVHYMTEGPIVVGIVEGSRVITGIRSIVGATDPTEAAPGTIRGDFGRDWGNGRVENLIHASDSLPSAKKEIKIWFPQAKFD